MKDFSKVRYLKFNATDEHGPEFIDVIVDLSTNRVFSGTIKMNNDDDNTLRFIVNGRNKVGNLINPVYNVFAKVVDEGDYYLLDEEFTPLYRSEGYVPELMDYFNNEPGYGDYIDWTFVELDTGKLKHKNGSIFNFNNADEWESIN